MKKLLLFAIAGCMQLAAFAQNMPPEHKPVRHAHHRKATAHHSKQHQDVQWQHHGNNKPTNVAKDDRNAYEGKPSQANDGVNKNKQRNINANTPTQLAPVNGNGGR